MPKEWKVLAQETPEPTSRWTRYMVFSPCYGGYLYRCWFRNGIFGCDEVGSIITGVTHYRKAGRDERSGQGTDADLAQFAAVLGA